ncbi:hypothetical protein, partial [Oceanobacillus saliphilus]|uniref:hypothetical protein n=1 Tax=Oceanobacillus saliphilus TaxID=2925834 RepID=UPI0034D4D138
MGNLTFDLVSEPTQCYFRVLPLGIYDGILGMYWLVANGANIHCSQGDVTFINKYRQEALVHRKN